MKRSEKQNRLTNPIRRIYICILVVIFFVILLSDVFLFQMEYHNYEEKLYIIYTMADSDNTRQDSLKLAGDLLKGNVSPSWQNAEQRLHDYGFTDGYKNVYKEEMYRLWGLIVLISVLIYTVFVLSGIFIIKSLEKKRIKELGCIHEMIVKLRDGRHMESGSRERMNISDDDAGGCIRMDLESLSSHLIRIKEQAGREKEETKSLVTDISHQLKTPVAALKTSFEILKSPELTQAEQEEFGNRCTAQIIRLEELIASLINISRMENGMIQINKIDKSIFETLVLSVNRIFPDAEENEMEISIEAEVDMQKMLIPHDTKWLSEAVINILENAVKYSPAGTSIVIRMIRMTAFLSIEIEDEGMGIPVNERNKIFKRFYRGDLEAVKRKAGSGVGLYLTREILERHGGTVTVTNPKNKKSLEDGTGSIFVLQIPYK